MKKILAMFLSAFALGCSEKKDEVFTLEEANMCLLESDKHAVMGAVELIKKAESEEDVSWLIRPRSPWVSAAPGAPITILWVRRLRVRRPIVYNIVEVTIDGGKKEMYGEQG